VERDPLAIAKFLVAQYTRVARNGWSL